MKHRDLVWELDKFHDDCDYMLEKVDTLLSCVNDLEKELKSVKEVWIERSNEISDMKVRIRQLEVIEDRSPEVKKFYDNFDKIFIQYSRGKK